MRFRDRREAGRLLAPFLCAYGGRDDVVVLALPRGGVPVGYEIACALDVPLDVFGVRKLGVPGCEELAMGAIAPGVESLNLRLIRELRLPRCAVAKVVERERRELARRQWLYRDERPALRVEGAVALLVDDGLATGASMAAAIEALRDLHPARIVVAVPVGPSRTCEMLEHVADDVVCCRRPEPFGGVGAWYEDFRQTSDAEVRHLLMQAASNPAPLSCTEE